MSRVRPDARVRPGASHAAVAQESAALIARDLTGLTSPAALDASRAFVSWSGSRGAAKPLLDETWRAVREAASEGADAGWVALGQHAGATLEYHPERTARFAGNRFFRLQRRLAIAPEAVVGALLDAKTIVELDATVRYCSNIAEFEATPDSHTRLVTVCASAGPRPLFVDRDDLDLTGWRRDADGTLWQASVTVPHHLASVSTAVRNHTQVWGYRLKAVRVGSETHTDATLVSMTEIFGWLPKVLVHAIITRVLADYLATLERVVRAAPPSEVRDMIRAAKLE